MPIVRDAREVNAVNGPRRKKPTRESLSVEKAIGEAEIARIGALTLHLKALPVRQAGKLQGQIHLHWPDVLLAAAVGDREGSGIDPETTAQTLTLQRKAIHEFLLQANPDAAAQYNPEPVTPEDVREAVGRLQQGLAAGEGIAPLCDTLWPLAMETDGLAWPKPAPPEGWEEASAGEGEGDQDDEPRQWAPPPPEGKRWLDDALLDTLRIGQFADLLRAMLLCMGGFPGDVSDRFTTP